MHSEWISGTFIVPKKHSGCCWVNDFHSLNKAIKWKVYLIPHIKDILERCRGYKYVSMIDLSMCFYTYVLDESSHDLTTIATLFGLYHFCHLPIHIPCCPDIAQEMIEKRLHDLNNVECYIDDIAIFSNAWDDHLESLDEVLTCLCNNGYAVLLGRLPSQTTCFPTWSDGTMK